MNYVEYGKENSDVIILLHGGGLLWWNYKEVAERLQTDYHVVLPILDGHAGCDKNFTTIENNALDIIEFVNSAQTASYSFTKDENITAFRFTYHKEKGNFALDNVSVTYGGTKPEYIVQDKIVTGLSCKFENLKKDTEYYYQVRSAIGDILSEQSERVAVKTSGNTGSIEKNEQNGLIFCSTNSGFRILGLQGNETVSVYTPSGTSIFETRANSAVIEIPASSRGIYIIGIKSSSGYKTMKVIR